MGLKTLTYERGDPQFPPRFSVYATAVLKRRVTDWLRQKNGRTVWKFRTHTYTRPKREFVSLDDAGNHELVESVVTRRGDSEADRDCLADGYSPSEIAEQLGTTNSWVSSRLRELREEIAD